MSYYKLRSFHLDKDGNPQMTVADSSTYPLTYFKSSITDGTPGENLERFCVDLLNGNIQPNNSQAMMGNPKRPGYILEEMRNLIKLHAPAVSFDRDLELKLDTTEKLYHVLAVNYGMPMLKGEQVDMKKLETELKVCNEEAKEAYKTKMQEYKDKGIVTIRAAAMSDVFPGFDILINANADECIVAKQENYNNGGMLDNGDGKALFLGNTSARLFHSLSNGGPGLSKERLLMVRDELVKRYGEPIMTKVEPDFLLDVIEHRKPEGLFFAQENGKWIAVDNTSGDAWTEEFSDKKDALAYLAGDNTFTEPTFEIYQLKEGEDLRDYHFIGYDALKRSGLSVRGDNYEKLYSGEFTQGSLEKIFEQFNIDRPDDFYGHSLSVSDIVVLHTQNTNKAFYVDSFGFREVPEFKPEPPGVIMQDITHSLGKHFGWSDEELDKPVTVELSDSEISLNAKALKDALRKAAGRSYYEKDPKITFNTGKDIMGRSFSKEARFSDIKAVVAENTYLYEEPAHRNARRIEEAMARRSQENGIRR